MFISNFGGDPIKLKKLFKHEVAPSSECDYNSTCDSNLTAIPA